MGLLDLWRQRAAKAKLSDPVRVNEGDLAHGAEVEEYNVGDPAQALSVALKNLQEDPKHYGGIRERWLSRRADGDFGDMMGRSGPIEGGDNFPKDKAKKSKSKKPAPQKPVVPACSGEEQMLLVAQIMKDIAKPDMLVALQRYGGAVAAEGKEGPNSLAKLGRELASMYAPELIPPNADDRFFDYTVIGVVRHVEYQMIVPALQRRGYNEMQAKNLAAEIVNKGMDLSRIEWDKGRGYKVDPGAIADVFTQLYIPFTGVAPDAKPDLSYDWKLREHQKREKETGTFQNFDPSVMPPLPENAPQSMADITTVDPKDRQRKLDQLLDQYSAEQDPERKKQIEQQMRSLRASIFGRWMLRRSAPMDPMMWGDEEPTFWHGSPSGDLRGAKNGLHVGTFEAARQALESRIGVPAEGEWDGTRVYGETLLAGRKKMAEKGRSVTGFNCGAGDDDYYPTPGKAVYSDGTPVSMDAKPIIAQYRIVGDMSNERWRPHEDFQANSLMRGQITRNRAKRGYYYTNVGEDAGSLSAVLPNGTHLERVSVAGAGMERTAKDAKRDSSCVMVNITDPKLKKAFSEITAMVDDDDVYDPPEDAKYGKENNFHVTCKYGLSTGDPDDVRPLIEGFGPIKAKITGVSFFRKEEKEYDVLKFDVDSDDLARLRKKIEDATEWTDENPKFHAHATIAYLKRGRAEKYCDDAAFAEKAEKKMGGAMDGEKGDGLVFDTVCFSSKDGDKTEIPCSSKTASSRWWETRLAKKSRRELQEEKHPDLKRETELICENKKKPEAEKPHDFKQAKWTHPNGHPRCLVCGGEEIIGGRCNVDPSAKDYADFEKELDAEFPDRVERRKKAEAAYASGEWTFTEFRTRTAMTDGVENLLVKYWSGAITSADLNQGLRKLRGGARWT